MSHQSLGATTFALNKFTSVPEAHKQALRIREKFLGDHEDTAQSHRDIGETYHNMRYYTSALKSKERALVMRQMLLENHPDTASSHLSIAASYLAQLNFIAACEASARGNFVNATVAYSGGVYQLAYFWRNVALLFSCLSKNSAFIKVNYFLMAGDVAVLSTKEAGDERNEEKRASGS